MGEVLCGWPNLASPPPPVDPPSHVNRKPCKPGTDFAGGIFKDWEALHEQSFEQCAPGSGPNDIIFHLYVTHTPPHPLLLIYCF